MSQATTTRISEVGTVGIPVADQERALRFYRDTLGFVVRMDAAYGADRWIELAPRGGATSIALVQARGALAAGVDTGIRLTTADAAADHEALRAAGISTDDLITSPVPMFVLRDPDGNRLYLVERPAG
jgi:catechol 2,3-dioxygenase-like lactoylglutathione lyase family enzyme